jgi:RNA polymerase sigma factor (sigma-70 family)
MRAMADHEDPRSNVLPPAEDEGGRAPSAGAVRALVENHRAFLAFLEKRVGRRDLAEDILQEAFARGIGRIETLKNDESVVAWFYRALRNAVIDRHRRRGAEERALKAFAEELQQLEEPVEEMRGAVCQCVARLAGTLKPEYAEALERIEVQGLSVKAFAEERGISGNNAAVRVFRAREALRRQVMASCGTCAEHGCLNCTCGEPERPATAPERAPHRCGSGS